MRGLLMAMMQQKDKVEKFKTTQNPLDALHAKYSSSTGQTVVGDKEWGHLQIDAVSLYLLILAQMTASGLQIVFNLDEVAFIQNLVFYIESAYCTPLDGVLQDYGIWERGDKTNHGLPELNASSIGMAKAALEAMNELDLFGARGGSSSIIHVLADEAQKCQAVLQSSLVLFLSVQSMLPRESNSKELDSGLLAIISFPAFAVDDPQLIQLTRTAIVSKLQGRYGCKRFLRDGYKTPKEDPSRLYYEPWELRMFDNIECDWPLFFCYLMLDYCFQGNKEAATEYTETLEEIMIRTENGMRLVPELYAVPADKVTEEYQNPGSQERIAMGRCPFMWAQSLYILGKLLQETLSVVSICNVDVFVPNVTKGFLAVGELDPLNRRLCSEKKPDVVVQVVILAEDENIREKLRHHEIIVQTIDEVSPIEVQPARVLSHLYTYLGMVPVQDTASAKNICWFSGRNKKLGLSGRKSRDVGILSTSKLYSLNDRIFAFTPQITDLTRFYVASDYELMIDIFKSEIYFLKSSWQNMLGRPLVVMAMRRIHLGLNPQVQKYLEDHLLKSLVPRPQLLNRAVVRKGKMLKRKMSVRGAIKKTRSIISMEADGFGHCDDRRPSLVLPSQVLTDIDPLGRLSARSPSPEDTMPLWKQGNSSRQRHTSETQYATTEVEELLGMLRETEQLEEQGDILQYLVDTQGLAFITGTTVDGKPVTVKDLLKLLYEKACQQKLWGLVRHSAGMLGKRVEDLAKAVTDLLVRQKQVTVGMPPSNEHTITAPLPEMELRTLIHQAYGDDESTAMLTQELLVYLAMFIRTEPMLFNEMLRLRVGLIIQVSAPCFKVMATELSRTLVCSGEEASEHLLNLSPFEMKNLLHHILSGKEFAISSVGRGNFSIVSCKSSRVSKKSQIGGLLGIESADGSDEMGPERQGQWLRRRRLDGALNRVPRDFYPRVWGVLEKMTPGELKFALAVETALNAIPQPEYRQLIVEALMVLTLVSEYNVGGTLGNIIMKVNGDATLCCAKPQDQRETSLSGGLLCGGAAYVCQHFYDSAPSGSYGTMTYLVRAVAFMLGGLPEDGEIDCTVS
uniref:Phosphorylase b kinase regulatory subunit n=1 Tax=Timema californicum TaxID=61474 RepID=A0A7R9JCN6_TIMCA|nr:unnamed protein product [Timema californicum]